MNQCRQSPGLVARQPVVDALVRDPVGLGDLTDPTTVRHDPQDGVGTLFRLGVGSRCQASPEPLSRIRRNVLARINRSKT